MISVVFYFTEADNCCVQLMFVFQISECPKVYVYDTPGIMLPHIPDMDVGMKLALCGSEAHSFSVIVTYVD